MRIICSLPERSKNVLLWVMMNFALLTRIPEREETQCVGCHQGNRVGSGSGRLVKSWRATERASLCTAPPPRTEDAQTGLTCGAGAGGLAGGGMLQPHSSGKGKRKETREKESSTCWGDTASLCVDTRDHVKRLRDMTRLIATTHLQPLVTPAVLRQGTQRLWLIS